MPYQPTVDDISGQILAQGRVNAANAKSQGILGKAQALATGTINAANTRLQGTQAMASGIGSAGSSIAGGISKAGQIFAENRAIMETNLGKMSAYQQMGLMTPEQADQVSSLKSPQAISAAMTAFDHLYYGQLAEQQKLANAKNMADLARAYDRTGQVLPAKDGAPAAMFTSANQIQLLTPKQPSPPPRPLPTQSGYMGYNPKTQAYDIPQMDPSDPTKRLMPQQPRLSLADQMLGLAPGMNEPAPGAPVGAGGQQLQVGQTATNPQTGEKIQWDGTKWVPVK